jgi:hypothetical protein
LYALTELARRPIVPKAENKPLAQVAAQADEPEDDPQLAFVFARMMQAWSREQIIPACRERFGIGWHRTSQLMRQVHDGLRSAHERNRNSRVEQIGRLRSYLVELHAPRYHATKVVPTGRKDAQGNPEMIPMRLPKDFLKIERLERLLAELEGNRVPERVEVHVSMTAAMGVVLGQMSDERMQELVERARERRRLALIASNGGKVA